MNIREKTEKAEEFILCDGARKSSESIGRVVPEEREDFRTDFMKDRDRILHSKSFRRLKHKTQVYIRSSEDHVRTRLTHTLEVSQVARTVCRGIGLNEDLVEAITLGHDLGHVAFAHNGEEVLNKLLPGGFRHNEQSLRVVEFLEKDGKGLNLTKEVLWGIKNHSGISISDTGKREMPDPALPVTLEADVAKYADKIAYVNHDIDDAIRSGDLKETDIPDRFFKILGDTHSKRIDTLVRDLVDTTASNLNEDNYLVALSPEKGKALMELRAFMFKNVYFSESQEKQREKAQFVVESLFSHFIKNRDEMPPLYRRIFDEEGPGRASADFIAGMTDGYALRLFREIFIP